MEKILQKSRQLYTGLLSRELPSYKRSLLKKVQQSKSKMIGIYGSRGVGKTTLMLQWLQQQDLAFTESLYISCDHSIYESIDLFELVEFFEKQGIKLLIIDEVHEAKNFEQSLKSIYDFLNIKIVFSGSSAISLTNPDVTRRFSMMRLNPFSLKEYIELSEKITLPSYSLESVLDDSINISQYILHKLGDKKILPLFKDYLKHGGYPFYFEDPDDFDRRVMDTVNLIINMELGRLFNIKPDKIDLLKKLLVVICRSKPLELSIEKITSAVEISKPTLYKFLTYLQRGELVRQVPHELKKYKTIRKADKLYLHHPNLLSAICVEPDIGTLRETFFASQLGRQHNVEFTDKADFLIDEHYLFEIGGRNKDLSQIKTQLDTAYLALDDIEIGTQHKIPLWLFGFLGNEN